MPYLATALSFPVVKKKKKKEKREGDDDEQVHQKKWR
jgi:hypothetical protein